MIIDVFYCRKCKVVVCEGHVDLHNEHAEDVNHFHGRDTKQACNQCEQDRIEAQKREQSGNLPLELSYHEINYEYLQRLIANHRERYGVSPTEIRMHPSDMLTLLHSCENMVRVHHVYTIGQPEPFFLIDGIKIISDRDIEKVAKRVWHIRDKIILQYATIQILENIIVSWRQRGYGKIAKISVPIEIYHRMASDPFTKGILFTPKKFNYRGIVEVYNENIDHIIVEGY